MPDRQQLKIDHQRRIGRNPSLRRGDDALTAGGSWWYGPEQARTDGVQWKAAGFYVVDIGFRCAYDAKG